MLFRQYYFNEYFGSGNIAIGDKAHIQNILIERKWDKVLDPYTLNKLINHYIKKILRIKI